MKKFILTCFLVSIYLYGSAQSKVAESPPGQDLFYRPGLYAGNRPAELAVLDTEAEFHGQESESSSAQQEVVLIYGEIINPDSLGSLTIIFSEGFLPEGEAMVDSTLLVQLDHGTFFDGVLDPRVQKFQTHIPVESDYARLMFKIGERTVFKDMLVFPGDSIKVGIDLQQFSVVFDGPQAFWFEVQYTLHRALIANQFSQARVLLENDRDELLDQKDFRAQLELQESVFGSRIAIYEFGKDGLDLELSLLMDSSINRIPGWLVLQTFHKHIPEERFRLLQSQLIGSYYAEHLATFRQYHHGMPLALGDSLSASHAKQVLPELLAKLDKDLKTSLQLGLSPGALDLAREWIYSEKILREEPLEVLIAEKYASPIEEKILYSAFLKIAETSQLSSDTWKVYQNYLEGSSVEKEFNVLKSTFEPGNYLAKATFHDLNGKKLVLEDFTGKPTLLYFYFSGCTHSGNYFRNYLQPFYREMGDKLGLQVIAVSVDNDSDLWKSQLSTYSSKEIVNLNFPNERAADWLRQYRVYGYPRSMLLDKEGKVLSYILDGKDYSEFSSNIISLLKNQHTNENQIVH
ncbi:TlpA family protein disulfide reductase [Algoriphagus antarcticus]|uniref:Cytochrome oxidase Cu insertion factor (SCO1/SenC/PrrC family) n=1 Tax=Algoriphagus antarcticus TaxID=238540 RepID=A0A3E0D683_9BACT|nr:TlpA disulfide reductase family protein [Algoriphagus antarcticus]REG77512.1 cytochrome oxidase Cu insertion factor (SCO1/SenC/PrrC family) [Algoriphagus antarcticus]